MKFENNNIVINILFANRIYMRGDNMSRKKGVILSYILMVFEVFNTLLLTPIIIKTLGLAEYGVYKLTIAINGYLLLLDLGIGNATIKYISKYRVNKDSENEKKFLGIVTIYYIIIGIITFLIGLIITYSFPYVFSKGLSNEEIQLGQILVFVTMVTSAISLGTSQFGNVVLAYEKFGISKISQIITIIIRICISYIALQLGFRSIALVLINLVMTLIIRVYFIFYVLFRIRVKPTFKNISKKQVKEIVFYSSWILLQMVATQVNSSIDQILIGAFVSSSAVTLAIYGVGSQVNQYFKSIGSAFTGVLMPGVVKLVENKASNKVICNEMIRIGRYILMVLILIWGVFLIEGREFIFLWAGKENINAYIVAIILMSVEMIVLTKSIGTQILWAKNEHKEQAILKFIIVLLNIGLTVILIKWQPLLGATVGTFISMLLGDVIVMDVIFHNKLGLKIKEFYLSLFKGILPAMMLSIIFGIIMNIYFNDYSLIGFAIKSGIMIMIYIIGMIIFGLNNDEKKLIYSMLYLKGGKIK